MMGRIMSDAGLDPTVIVGGVVSGKESGGSLGTGDYFVAEADEFDRSFLSMFPSMAIVTNIEPDHLECYEGMEDLEKAFLTYMNRVPFYGLVVYSADDPILARLQPQITRPSVTFGLSHGADYRAERLVMKEGRSEFAVLKRGQPLGIVPLNVPGEHNVRNAMAAIAAASELDISFETIADALIKFRGVARRFEIKGVVNDIMVVDDYAHHPTEITAVLKAVRVSFQRRLICIFQPHLFSRTSRFYREFATALGLADICLLVDIFPAREDPVEGVTSELISDYARKQGFENIRYIGPIETVVPETKKIARPGDIIITMGAGSITRINPELLEALKNL